MLIWKVKALSAVVACVGDIPYKRHVVIDPTFCLSFHMLLAGPPASQVVLCYPIADRDAEESTVDSFPSKDFSEEYRELAGFLSSSTGAKIFIYSQRQSPIQLPVRY